MKEHIYVRPKRVRAICESSLQTKILSTECAKFSRSTAPSGVNTNINGTTNCREILRALDGATLLLGVSFCTVLIISNG